MRAAFQSSEGFSMIKNDKAWIGDLL
ncbi:TPA: DUF1819 domain-containing protein, partial [Klebsiella pneumoniae subsp. pneumoniae]|nr:DUF1819 domain-containing protein [Klebsiella pneumoniae subsp. pneumoniae]